MPKRESVRERNARFQREAEEEVDALAPEAPKLSEKSVKWTGKNLSEIKKFHRDVAHYPIDPEDDGPQAPRDASQHPDNLHVHGKDGTTSIARVGDTITKDAAGRITVTSTRGK